MSNSRPSLLTLGASAGHGAAHLTRHADMFQRADGMSASIASADRATPIGSAYRTERDRSLAPTCRYASGVAARHRTTPFVVREHWLARALRRRTAPPAARVQDECLTIGALVRRLDPVAASLAGGVVRSRAGPRANAIVGRPSASDGLDLEL
jgi:hypothetical protein